jgi:hypothetical protein
VAAPSSRGHRNFAGGNVLWREETVSTGRAVQNERGAKKWLGRCAVSPERCRSGRGGRRRRDGIAIIGEMHQAGVAEEELGVDVGAPGSYCGHQENVCDEAVLVALSDLQGVAGDGRATVVL